jgi:PAS domain S-box-containing protein
MQGNLSVSAASEKTVSKVGRRKPSGRPMEARLAKQGRDIALLRARLERYECALQGSNVTVFTQMFDGNGVLRFASISNPLLGNSIENIVGKADEDIFPLSGREQLAALKQRAVESPNGASEEIALGEGEKLRWFDLHAVPLRESGKTVGLACAAIDITERKTNESHLRPACG